MNIITVGTTPTLLAQAGNRKFLHIFNNDSNTIFLSYDGTHGITMTTQAAAAYSNGTGYTAVTVNSVMGILPGMTVNIGGFNGAVVQSVNPLTNVITFTINFSCTANVAIGDTFTLTQSLTTANGAPLYSGNFLFLDNAPLHNHYTADVWAISVAGNANVRLQGA